MGAGKTITWISLKLLDKSTDHVTETEMIRKILKQGNKINYYCGYRKKKTYYGLGKETIHYIFMPPIPKIRTLFYHAGLLSLMFRTLFIMKPDVVIIDYLVNIVSLPILLLGRMVNRRPKVILDVRTIPVNAASFPWAIKIFFFSLQAAGVTCDGMTFISPYMRDYCTRRVNLKDKKTAVWTSGVNEELFDPEKYEKTREDHNFEVFYHGGITLSRGIGSLIKAVKILKDRDYPVSLKLMGNIVNEKEIRRLVRENRLGDVCTISRPVPYEDVPQIIKNCDLPVIPFPRFIGWRVSSPLKLLEYLAMGKAVVLTNIEAHRDVVDGSGFAFFTETSDPEHIAAAIEGTYRIRDRLEKLGQGARDLALRKYTWGRQAQELLSFLDSL
jgi:glycosyltransferase involved in cell wall biosynthesis